MSLIHLSTTPQGPLQRRLLLLPTQQMFICLGGYLRDPYVSTKLCQNLNKIIFCLYICYIFLLKMTQSTRVCGTRLSSALWSVNFMGCVSSATLVWVDHWRDLIRIYCLGMRTNHL